MDNKILKGIVSWIIIASLFITGDGFEGLGFRIYWYYPFYVIFVVFAAIAYHRMNTRILMIFIGIILYNIFTNMLSLNLIVKQTINIGFSFTVFYYFILHENSDLLEIFRKYILVAKIVLVIGFIQVLLFTIDYGVLFIKIFPFLENIDITQRLQSVTQEPSFIAYTFAPICFLGLYNLFYRSRFLISGGWSALFVLGYCLTFSTIAYTGLLCMLLLLFCKNFSVGKLKVAGFAFAGIFLIGWIAYQNISFLKIRVDDTITGVMSDFTEGDIYAEVNLSTYALLSNAYVTRKSLEENLLTGNGVGTHEAVYDKYAPEKWTMYSTLNRQDANSMSLRLLTETGIIGLLLFCYFAFRFRVRSHWSFSDDQNLWWVLSNGIFVLILLSLLRNGNYTVHGKILFLFIYYFIYKEVQSFFRSQVKTTPT